MLWNYNPNRGTSSRARRRRSSRRRRPATLFVTVLCLALVGDGLRSALDPKGRELTRLRPAAPALRAAARSRALSFLTFFVYNKIPTSPACLVVACGPKTTTTDAMYRAAEHQLGIDRPVLDAVRRLVVARRPRRRLRRLVGVEGAGRLVAGSRASRDDLRGARRDGADAPARRAVGRVRRDPSAHSGGPRSPRAQPHRARDPPVRPRQPDQRVLLRSPPCLLDLLPSDGRRNAAARR